MYHTVLTYFFKMADVTNLNRTCSTITPNIQFIDFMNKASTCIHSQDIEYSTRIHDGTSEMRYSISVIFCNYKYRWVSLPQSHPLFLFDPSERFRIGRLAQLEWRSLGIQMSKGWEHVGFSPFEFNVLVFKRDYNG